MRYSIGFERRHWDSRAGAGTGEGVLHIVTSAGNLIMYIGNLINLIIGILL